jgi:limonene-1,2-epoxide hydrolase
MTSMMRSIGRLGSTCAGLLLGVLVASALVGCGSGTSSTPRRTIDTFLQASALGDGSTACAQLTPQARGEVVKGLSCQQGIADGASVYGAIIGQIKVGTVSVQGSTATGTSVLNGRTTATFRLSRREGKWLIVDEQRVAAASENAAGADTPPPTEARVEAVAGCLDDAFGLVDNAGMDSTGGVPHSVLTVNAGGTPAAEVDVFSTALAALSDYRRIQSARAGKPTVLASTSVVVYVQQLTARKRHTVEACG